MLQIERLMIPKLLALEDLATFAVLAAIVISPFRLLQMSVARTLVPRLRNAMTISARRRLLIHEAAIVHGMALVGCAAIWYLMPVLSDWVLRAKYHFSAGLMLAAIASGLIRVLSGFANAAVTALASSQRLAVWNLWSWILVAGRRNRSDHRRTLGANRSHFAVRCWAGRAGLWSPHPLSCHS